MSLSKAIRFAYNDALFGPVKIGDIPVPIFDVFAMPENVPYPYILLSTQTSFQRVVKRCKIYNASILIDIVTGSNDNSGGRIQAEDIAEQIEDIINPDTFEDLDLTSYGYSIGDTTRESDTDLSNMSNGIYIQRKLIRYSHIISKLN